MSTSRMLLFVLILAWSRFTIVGAWTSKFAKKPTSTQCLSMAERSTLHDLIVVSPPGGVGEVTAVKAAELGSSVRWFVVSQSSDDNTVVISQEILNRIKLAGGSFALAGATDSSLLTSDLGSSLKAVSAWCGAAKCLVVSTDGIVDKRKKKDQEDPTISWKNSIKLAAKQVSASITNLKIAIVSASDDEEALYEEEEQKALGFNEIINGLVGGKKPEIPLSIRSALGEFKVVLLRHGQLFGTPESSPDFSPFVGGLRRQPELCPEYYFASVRVDPTISLSGNRMKGTRSSRHAVGQAAALLATARLPISKAQKLDVCVSSQPGTSQFTLAEWNAEFERVNKLMKSGQVALLFETEFTSVPDTNRFADWLVTKWAPAVLRTYDIAAIRTGARPVYAARVNDEDASLEIVWQQLVNFESVTAGRMIIQVTETGMKAIRGPGDSVSGFGSISIKPLQGEDVFVRRLSEAASQAVEKGLAVKSTVKESFSPEPTPTVVSSIQSSGTVVIGSKIQSTSVGSQPIGPRRSTERTRGTKRQQSELNE